MYTRATVMAANDYVPDFQYINRKLQNRKAVQVRMHDYVRDIAMNKYITRWQA
ncbi:MAG: hypothetical protein NVSMB6_04990 [Burkholderiaceae bacterium]